MSTLETRDTRPADARTLLAWAALMGVTLGVIYAPILRDLWSDWAHDDNYSHGFLVPLVTGYLLWTRRAALRAAPLRTDVRALWLLAPSLALLLLGTAGAEYFLQRASLVGLVGGLLWFGCGPAWARLCLFPVSFLLFAVPVPYVLYYSASFPLQQLAARAATAALTGIGIPAVRVGNTIELPNTSLEVAEACSGLRSLVSLLAMGALFGRFGQDRAAKRWVLFLSTIPIAILGNALRVFVTGLGVYLGGPRWAEGAVHEAMGLLVFAFALVALLITSVLLRGLRIQPAPPPEAP
ncbi:MAG TPA: exosortase/archaeosortase family protein [Candidatus Saccharimonadales bacterium]|nr:exosortase/archaeosortase family protein [Candidatus Saccharimonadales bacterium]